MKIKYDGWELIEFDNANNFREYQHEFISKTIIGKTAEIGPGRGGNIKSYIKKISSLTLYEPTLNLYKFLKKRYKSNKKIKVINKTFQRKQNKLDTIIYLDVIEHIRKDKLEINNALNNLKNNNHLIINVPAFNLLYSQFDKEIGHFRRYEMNFFNTLNLKNTHIKKKFFIDSFGYLLYFLNKVVFSKEVYPSKLKIFIWDKIFIPITYLVDFFSFYKLGKNIVCIIQKKIK